MKRLALLLLCCAVAMFGAASCSRTEAPAPVAAKGRPQQETITRGQYLAAVGDCYACHTVRGSEAYAGGLEMPTPFGKLYTPNITPDPEFGIGKWSADDFWRAMHDGKSKDGSFLYPGMPFTNYTLVTREDSDAIYAYFMSLKPVKQKSRPHEMGFPYNQRELLAGWRTLFFKEGVFKEDPKQSKEWNRGAYLVNGLGHCNACHSTRNMLGAVTKEDISGGLIPLQNWYAPSLTSSRETGLGDWDIKDIVDLAIQLESRAKDRKDIETLRSIISLTQAVQSSEAEIVERDIRVMHENAQLVRDKAELERQLAEAQSEEIRIHSAIEFRRGKRTGGQWMPFCPTCHAPARVSEDFGIICSAGCHWCSDLPTRELQRVISQL